MASRFVRIEVVHAAADSSAVGLSAYISRSARVDLDGKKFDFSHRKDELVAHGVVLPAGAPGWANEPGQLWREAERAEQTVDRKTGEVRWKKRGQTAKHMVIALPRELTDQQQQELVEAFIDQVLQPLRHGVALEWAIHRDSGNPHAHLIYSTRTLGPEGFGKKARDMNPEFATGARGAFIAGQDAWDARWADFQEAWFAENGIFAEVRERQKMRFTRVNRGQLRKPGVVREREAVEAANAAAAAADARDPVNALFALTKRKAIFASVDLRRYCRRQGISGDELDRFFQVVTAHPDVIELLDEDGGHRGWTTRQVREQENSIVVLANEMLHATGANLGPIERALLDRSGLSLEQRMAAHQVTGASRLGLLIGRAGTGKSFTLDVVRRAYEAGGYRVLGLAPTNAAVGGLRAGGFTQASTLHRELGLFESGRHKWDAKTVVIVDEAAIVDSGIMSRLFVAAGRSGAKLIVAGDDRQFESVGRGGLFSELVRRYGAAELREVLRQRQDWQARASESYAVGEVRAALEAYDKRGQIVWTDTLEEARRKATEDGARTLPGRLRFLYAATNVEVERLNLLEQSRLRLLRATAGEIVVGEEFGTTRGRTNLAVGERMQFYQTDHQLGVFTSEFGTALEVSETRILVAKDDGERVAFDPRRFDQWGLGYAGTAYKGQGTTQPETGVLYDNPYAWDARAAYVIGTRHRDDMRLYVARELAPDLDALVEQIERPREDRSASVRYRTRESVEADFHAEGVAARFKEAVEQSREQRAAWRAEQHARQEAAEAAARRATADAEDVRRRESARRKQPRRPGRDPGPSVEM